MTRASMSVILACCRVQRCPTGPRRQTGRRPSPPVIAPSGMTFYTGLTDASNGRILKLVPK